MAADLKLIRGAIADRLAAVFQDVGPDGEAGWTVSPVWLAQPDVPALVVIKGPTDYGEAMGIGTLAKLNLTVVAYVNFANTNESQDTLDELLSPTGARSVYSTLMDPDHNSQVTLGGLIGDLDVKDDSGHRIYKIAGAEYLGAEWHMEVYA